MRPWMKAAALFCFLLFSSCSSEVPVASAPDRQDAELPGATAVFAGGCFWCMEPPFDALEGVLDTRSGYAGGLNANPSYKAVTDGGTGHLEVVEVRYDPQQVSFDELLAVFWQNIDPLDDGGQFCDRGESYRTAVFVRTDAEAAQARASREAIAQQLGQPVVTRVLPLPASGFSPAEGYHQNYYQENPIRYKYYRSRCGRDARLAELWATP